jgi:hypothetical protein
MIFTCEWILTQGAIINGFTFLQSIWENPPLQERQYALMSLILLKSKVCILMAWELPCQKEAQVIAGIKRGKTLLTLLVISREAVLIPIDRDITTSYPLTTSSRRIAIKSTLAIASRIHSPNFRTSWRILSQRRKSSPVKQSCANH